MNYNISKDLLEEANNFIEEKFGLHFPEERFNDLTRGLSNASKEKCIPVEKYIKSMILNELSQEDLINLPTHLTIGETYFFRDEKLFQAMRQKILPDIINSKKYSNRSLKIWSAGCSSGEEAYSIAILVKELIPDYECWDIKIIATDINETFINKAKTAVYSEWSFRGMDLNFKNKYFYRVDNSQYKLKDSISKLVKFYNVNLASHTYLVDNRIINNIDIIFCRNVLIYFSEYQAREIINRFYNTIINGGWLSTAPTESLYLNNTHFKTVNINGTFLYNKSIEQNNLFKSIYHNVMVEDLYTPMSKQRNLNISEELFTKYKQNELKVEVKSKDDKVEHKLEDKIDIKELETLCLSFANEGNFEEAIEWCKKAIHQDKINPFYYNLLASIQQEQGNISEAIASLKKAIYLDPNFTMAYFQLGNLSLKQDKFKEAHKNFQNALLLIKGFNEGDIIPYSAEITVGMLKEVIENIERKGD